MSGSGGRARLTPGHRFDRFDGIMSHRDRKSPSRIAAALLLVAGAVLALRARPAAAADSGPPDPYASLPLEQRVEAYQKQLEATPGDALVHFRLGNAYYDLQQVRRAVDEYKRSVELDPNLAVARGNLGAALEEIGDMQEAEIQYQKAVELTPNDPSARSNLGSAYYALQKYAEAVDEYREALRLDPDHAEARFNLGVAFADCHMYSEAIREWQKVLELAPRSEAAKNAQKNIALLESLRTREEKRAQTEKPQDAKPSDP